MNLFAGTSAGVFLSTNNGANWTKKYGPTDVASFAVTTNTLGVVTLYAGAFRSTDAGTNWTQTLPTYVIVDGRSVMPTCKALLSNNNNLFIGSLNYGVLMTSDDYHFTPANEGFFPLTTVNALSLNGTVLFAGTSDAGVWKRSLAQMTTAIGRPDAVYPLQFTLEQNYPNPFNPSTAISFQLSAASFVSLRVYDMLGKQVATLVSQELQAGYYSTKWMADVPSGVYLYRIEAIETGNTGKRFVETRKMILLR
jgi:hypothetical protein